MRGDCTTVPSPHRLPPQQPLALHHRASCQMTSCQVASCHMASCHMASCQTASHLSSNPSSKWTGWQRQAGRATGEHQRALWRLSVCPNNINSTVNSTVRSVLIHMNSTLNSTVRTLNAEPSCPYESALKVPGPRCAGSGSELSRPHQFRLIRLLYSTANSTLTECIICTLHHYHVYIVLYVHRSFPYI